ncbi:fumarylacetoacetate hydrolase family protein [Rhodococcus sp. BP-149]|nr:fumarylacetoacetate hydrolase family protein [Rhodococcus sp. BP-288]MBY6696020.1 fumarylacetoacetate hydrolase family protein [Rhodococcus sp. BP-188]MBY6700617.1 fumarylacetoacetate hydrolase family protein [Rhodococcus sp. BP-285]MBY6705014.1 fumarylacetoacetate hydrolase family protein [Rhodococcus sp. BP-283]MBY6713742.1 fumarylacetoacetate hydrolase family protein [Rhodococcus sp. BP-160]MBY6715641.1 fumarylacetoacetate hydrolase family protein [Rhodococcus sp. BP-110]MBY6722097.1 fu
MKIANVQGRAALVENGFRVDVGVASGGRFGPCMPELYSDWQQFTEWAESRTVVTDGTPFLATEAGPPSPDPRQVFAVGINYRQHAAESGWPVPEVPLVFTKFPSSITGPHGEIALPSDVVDWEVEVVVVIGTGGRHISADRAREHIAGVTTGQDLSERRVQMRPKDGPQYSLGKSFPGFAPIGPVLYTTDEIPDLASIPLTCALNGRTVQQGSTADLIFSIPELVSYLSGIVRLLPGDLIFTGSPSGVGAGMTPPRFLTSADTIVSAIMDGDEMRQTFRDEIRDEQ